MALAVILEPIYEPRGLRSYWGCPPGSEYVCSFENEAIYWLLYPLFVELKGETGKDIDLYDVCSFGGTELKALSDTIESAYKMIEGKPESWDVVTGFFTDTGEEIRESVSKQEVQVLLGQISKAIQKAERDQIYLR